MRLFNKELLADAETILELYRRAAERIATAESCTGGLIGACLSEIPGASDVLECGVIAYSNVAKGEFLGVPKSLIETAGAVSADVAEAMAAGALARSGAHVAVSATGVAGPGGGTANKPVGLVYVAVCRRGDAPSHERHQFAGDRTAVRLAAVRAALDLLRRSARPVSP